VLGRHVAAEAAAVLDPAPGLVPADILDQERHAAERPAAERVFVDIVDAVGDRLDVLVDGGIRRGVDVAVALALGARAVMVGRLPLWGLAAGGEEGARTALELLRDETAVALHLMGLGSTTEVSREAIGRAT